MPIYKKYIHVWQQTIICLLWAKCVCLCLNFAEVEAKGETDCLDVRQLSDIVNKDQLVKMTAKHCPGQAFAFWITEAEMNKTELEQGQEIRLKTKGDGPFICEYNAENSMYF